MRAGRRWQASARWRRCGERARRRRAPLRAPRAAGCAWPRARCGRTAGSGQTRRLGACGSTFDLRQRVSERCSEEDRRDAPKTVRGGQVAGIVARAGADVALATEQHGGGARVCGTAARSPLLGRREECERAVPATVTGVVLHAAFVRTRLTRGTRPVPNAAQWAEGVGATGTHVGAGHLRFCFTSRHTAQVSCQAERAPTRAGRGGWGRLPATLRSGGQRRQ